MSIVLKEVDLEIYLDLKRFSDESGHILNQDGVNPTIVGRRKELRSYLGSSLIGLDIALNASSNDDDTEYVNHYLRSEHSAESINELYYMKLTECEHRPDTFHLEIILDEGFLTFMETSPSENKTIFLQGVLQTLYDNGVTNTGVVNYYMEQSSLKSKLFKNAI